ncbi:hypothetical protein HOLleu_19320 [Holothuria leucospilota]|uniref:Uncharacterized protein n=1 Tax=Holothuria leucospilota TaxID=206669 RepID=A0A9Q1H4W9_HOLLE|nr:hypothetical protein HOLleu_19320 [Holothuria leucospilota]
MMSQSRKCSLVWRKLAYHCRLHQQMQTAGLSTGGYVRKLPPGAMICHWLSTVSFSVL